jgi:hypothetical protein
MPYRRSPSPLASPPLGATGSVPQPRLQKRNVEVFDSDNTVIAGTLNQ